ncbi:hypothetical protein R3P38DRAFT_3394689 [Favolaschia claudopus]|uniref:Thaumatin-like protein n=1 Tax=Favolaschia claudopus TaxID=2862362 RepID=A0AAW0BT50_9AGAR
MQQFSSLATLAFVSLATMVSAEPSTARFITVLNDCPFTIWYVLSVSFDMRHKLTHLCRPAHSSWEAKPNTGLTFATATNWSGRIWGRRVCDFSTGSTGPDTCLSGGCNGGLICNTTTGTGVPPATLATIDFSGTSKDIYTEPPEFPIAGPWNSQFTGFRCEFGIHGVLVSHSQFTHSV